MKVNELTPGDQVVDTEWVFIASVPHPFYLDLRLVIWKKPPNTGEASFDALSRHQDVGRVEDSTWPEKDARLRAALIGDGS